MLSLGDIEIIKVTTTEDCKVGDRTTCIFQRCQLAALRKLVAKKLTFLLYCMTLLQQNENRFFFPFKKGWGVLHVFNMLVVLPLILVSVASLNQIEMICILPQLPS